MWTWFWYFWLMECMALITTTFNNQCRLLSFLNLNCLKLEWECTLLFINKCTLVRAFTFSHSSYAYSFAPGGLSHLSSHINKWSFKRNLLSNLLFIIFQLRFSSSSLCLLSKALSQSQMEFFIVRFTFSTHKQQEIHSFISICLVENILIPFIVWLKKWMWCLNTLNMPYILNLFNSIRFYFSMEMTMET